MTLKTEKKFIVKTTKTTKHKTNNFIQKKILHQYM